MDCGQIILTYLPSHGHGDIPASGSSSQSAQASSVSASKPLASCPWCTKNFKRKQELKRHISSFHLPYWICCPHPSCPWRGARIEKLRMHMKKGRCGSEARLEQYRIYDPSPILDGVLNDSDDTPNYLKLFSAEMDAAEHVLKRAKEPQKVHLCEDPWGYQPKGMSDFAS